MKLTKFFETAQIIEYQNSQHLTGYRLQILIGAGPGHHLSVRSSVFKHTSLSTAGARASGLGLGGAGVHLSLFLILM